MDGIGIAGDAFKAKADHACRDRRKPGLALSFADTVKFCKRVRKNLLKKFRSAARAVSGTAKALP
jgi:hypothetical protein